MKQFTFSLIALLLAHFTATAQKDSFDVFTYAPPEFFIKSELPSRVQFSIKNSDTSFCLITLYKSLPVKADIMKDISSQWNEQVLKRLNKADKKPGRIYTQQMWDGWASTIAIGNFYQNKKKAVVMLNSFRKDTLTGCIIFAFSDKSFKSVVENFSSHLHLIK